MEEIYLNYKIVPSGSFGMKKIKAVGKGSVHQDLRGTYTNAGFAKRAIELFLKSKKVKADAKVK